MVWVCDAVEFGFWGVLGGCGFGVGFLFLLCVVIFDLVSFMLLV